MERFRPDLLIVSAGFDAHVDDPMANIEVTDDGFRELARRARGLAPRFAAVLEEATSCRRCQTSSRQRSTDSTPSRDAPRARAFHAELAVRGERLLDE